MLLILIFFDSTYDEKIDILKYSDISMEKHFNFCVADFLIQQFHECMQFISVF